MRPQKLPASGNQVTATDTATDLLSLIRTAASDTGWQVPNKANSVILQADDGDIRYTVADIDPTGTTGMELTDGNSVPLEGVDLSTIKLIRVGGTNVKVNIMIYYQENPR